MENFINRIYRSHRSSIVGCLLFLIGIALMFVQFPVRFDALQDVLVTTFITAGLVGLKLKDSPAPQERLPPQNLPQNEKRTDPSAPGRRSPGRAE